MLSPYLSFSGNCEEAFVWYAEVFSGAIVHLSRYGDIPTDPAHQLSEDIKRQVMHAELVLPNLGSLSGADSLTAVSQGTSVALHAAFPSVSEAHSAFDALAVGGAVISPIVSNPPPDDQGISGALIDRYGFTWIVSGLKD
ncbi:hypothetical protein U6G28_03200 [Actinomycetaceae bacterium MB13-C1-2]|nr:hypothetical protein U6G28_03200 [Actinomycetaceae bacterium MB13-C1-2]